MVSATLPDGASAWTRKLADAALPEDVVRREVLDSVAQPDIVVIEPSQFEMDAGVLTAPTLVIEVLSPSTRRRDLVVKRRLYERHGVAPYLVVDADERSLTWLRCHDLGRLVETAVAAERLRMDSPFEVELTLPAI